MGCFLGCFGLSKKRKRRKPSIGALNNPDHQRLVCYEPLYSSISANPDPAENPITSDSELRSRDKPKERSSSKIRKKVSFNLNVQAYEPIQTDYHILKSDEDEKAEQTGEETAEPSDSTALRVGSYPSNHRYQNCIDSYDEDDELVYEEVDLEDYDDIDHEGYDGCASDVLDENSSQEEFSGQFHTSSMDSHKSFSVDELKLLGLNQNVRDRSQYVQPVLNPIQNLSQWKAVKARAAAPKHPRKENVASAQEPTSNFSPFTSDLEPNLNHCKPPIQEVAIDASLSNWMLVTRSSCSEHVIKESILDKSNSWRSIEDRPILDFTRLETR